MRARRQTGLTLVEILIALAVFALVASGCVYALRLGVDARERLGETDRNLTQFRIARALIRDDMAQLVPRRVRDEFGEPAFSYLAGGDELRLRRRDAPGETVLLSFVRGGWINPEHAAPRSELQYVEYVERDGDLIRRARTYLDDARGQPRFERVLFENAGAVEIALLFGEQRGELNWISGWPPAGRGSFPRAIQITAGAGRIGSLPMRFWIGDIAAGEPARAEPAE